ncbi:MAG TPA: MFS transporter [Dermatophilaceae bacterium]|nr:MFS transporter [Dermatophilaceae bacterium]
MAAAGEGEALTRRGIPLDPQLRVLAIGAFATRFGSGAVMTTSAIYFTRHLGFTVGEVALAVSVAAAAAMIAALPAGHLGDTRGPREVLNVIMLALAVATPLPVLATSPWVLTLLLAVEAALASAANAVRNGLTAQVAIGGRGVQFKAYLRAVTNSGIALGSVVGGAALVVDTRAAYVSVFVMAGVLCGFAAWNTTRLTHLPPYRRPDGEPRLGVLRDLPFVAVVLSTSMFSVHFVAAELGLALFVSQRTQAPQVMVAVLLLVNTVAVASLQVRLSTSADSVATGGRALVRGGALIAVGFALIGLADGSSAWVAVAVLLAGASVHVVGEMIGSGGQWALQMGLAPHERQGQYQGFASLGFSLMNVVGPPVVTLLCIQGGRLGWVAMGLIVLVSGVAAQALGRWALANRTAYGVTTHSG